VRVSRDTAALRPPSGEGPSRTSLRLAPVVGIAVGLVAWWLAARFLFRFLPDPLLTLRTFGEQVATEDFFVNLGVTARRVLLGTVGGFLVGSVIGLAMGRIWTVEKALHPWVFVGLALPGPLVILLAILAMGLGEMTTLAALWAVVTPFVVTLVYGGAKALDPELLEMSSAYRFSRWERLRQVMIPALLPSLMSGLRVAFAMSWKIVVLIEALSSTVGIGERIHFYFTFNQPAAVLAWTFSFTIIMVLVEVLVFQTLDRRLFAWRPKARL
jgi:NitT/TauT family transport system permease protein